MDCQKNTGFGAETLTGLPGMSKGALISHRTTMVSPVVLTDCCLRLLALGMLALSSAPRGPPRSKWLCSSSGKLQHQQPQKRSEKIRIIFPPPTPKSADLTF